MNLIKVDDLREIENLIRVYQSAINQILGQGRGVRTVDTYQIITAPKSRKRIIRHAGNLVAKIQATGLVKDPTGIIKQVAELGNGSASIPGLIRIIEKAKEYIDGV